MLDKILAGDTDSNPEKDIWLPSLEAGDKLNLNEMVANFEKTILDHAIQQYKTTRKIAAYLGTSQSKVARMLKKILLPDICSDTKNPGMKRNVFYNHHNKPVNA